MSAFDFIILRLYIEPENKVLFSASWQVRLHSWKYILTLAVCLHFLVSESTSPLSTNDFSVPGKNWGTEISDVGTMCEQFNTEFKKKFNVSYWNYTQ